MDLLGSPLSLRLPCGKAFDRHAAPWYDDQFKERGVAFRGQADTRLIVAPSKRPERRDLTRAQVAKHGSVKRITVPDPRAKRRL